ncbi:hypothetical protein MAPG_08790 [Magnaporthiopsis poae ATCC 64411]|uniref:MARVEL domain-containing protein n=1 Tax=Magnaporthiopsis poae (strain ATCC 64411 / 73-15) TaxID=644358 RepID=A0A0C4E893_MAGP6|nr:hypothetical protein MAPG_08790 [Magnaporthiopsis poae ATCC 64411]
MSLYFGRQVRSSHDQDGHPLLPLPYQPGPAPASSSKAMMQTTPPWAQPTTVTRNMNTQTKTEVDPKTARRARRIKILRVVQSILAALLSLAIAAFQGRVYFTYYNTREKGGTWPNVPNTMPTILLFSIALAALVFDGCMLVAYMWPSTKFARWAVTIGGAAQYMVSSTKTVGFAISAVVSKTSFDFGNASGTNPDLWSYTCTDQAAALNSMIQAESNCDTQWASWVFALAQVAIEVFGWIVSILAFRQTEQRLSAQAMEQKMTAYSSNVNSRLHDATPNFDIQAGHPPI